MLGFKRTLASLTAMAAMLVAPSGAQAALMLKIHDGISDASASNKFADLVIEDNGLLDLAAAAGAVTFIGSYGDYSLAIASGTSILDPLVMTLGVQAQMRTGVPTHAIVFELTQTGLSSGVGGLVNFTGESDVRTVRGGAFEFFADPGNLAFGTGTRLYGGAGDGRQDGGGSINATGLYSATIRSTVDYTGVQAPANGSISLGLKATTAVPVPEPGSLALSALALLGLAAARRRTV